MDGWQPGRESLCDYVRRKRIEQQMAETYDDTTERTLAQARGMYWPREKDDDSQLGLFAPVHDTDKPPW